MMPPIALLAVLFERAVGYPDRVVEVVGHPVTWIGRLIDGLDGGRTMTERATAGGGSWGLRRGADVLVSGGSAGPCRPWRAAGSGSPLTALAASTLIAQRSLAAHVEAVAQALETDGLGAGRDGGQRASSGAIRRASTRPASRARRSRASPRTSRTASSRRCSGCSSPGCRAPRPTRRSTPPTA